jgi:hypothetical protein
VDIAVIFAGEGDKQEVRKLKYRVPPGAPVGTLFITAGDGTSTNLAESRALLAASTRPARQMIPLLNAMRSNSSAYVRLWRADTTYSLGGVGRSEPACRPGDDAGAQPDTADRSGRGRIQLTEMEIALGDVVVAGTKTIQLEIKDLNDVSSGSRPAAAMVLRPHRLGGVRIGGIVHGWEMTTWQDFQARQVFQRVPDS